MNTTLKYKAMKPVILLFFVFGLLHGVDYSGEWKGIEDASTTKSNSAKESGLTMMKVTNESITSYNVINVGSKTTPNYTIAICVLTYKEIDGDGMVQGAQLKSYTQNGMNADNAMYEMVKQSISESQFKFALSATGDLGMETVIKSQNIKTTAIFSRCRIMDFIGEDGKIK